ncbi:MAG: hypothetical protein IKY75_03255 [Bacteroidaceae bacterium]|nr:hypothetical protein [Bacteroidaceae bacterium]
MKKGYLAHYCCCGNTTYKHSTILVDDNRLDSIKAFAAETANTTFYDGLLIVVAPSFHTEEDIFLSQLHKALASDTQQSITEAIVQNSTYIKNSVAVGDDCCIYTLSPISWHNMRPDTTQGAKIKLIKTL